MIRFSESWEGNGFITVLKLCVAVVQYVPTPCGEVDVLFKFWQTSGEISLVEVTHHNEGSSWVAMLLFVNHLLQL